METADIKHIVEALLLCADEPLSVKQIASVFDDHLEIKNLDDLLMTLSIEWQGKGVNLVQVASGWRFQSVPHVQRYIERLKPEKPPRYTRAVLETLAIIAYKQPVTRGDIEDIRGVTVSSQIIKTLEDRGWIESVGHRDVPGRPMLFATTKAFLDDLSLVNLASLPLESESNALLEKIQSTMMFDANSQDGATEEKADNSQSI